MIFVKKIRDCSSWGKKIKWSYFFFENSDSCNQLRPQRKHIATSSVLTSNRSTVVAYQICLRWQWKIYNNLYGWHVWYWHTTHIQITSAQLEYPWESVNENYGILQCSGAYNLLNLFHIHKKKTFFSKVLVFGFAFVFFLFCITWSSAFIPKKYFSTRYQVEFALAFATSCTFLCNTQNLKVCSKFIVIITYYPIVIPVICHESHENSRVNFFWPV